MSRSGHESGAELEHEDGWNKIEIFKDKDIVKIALGTEHSLFLDENGIVGMWIWILWTTWT